MYVRYHELSSQDGLKVSEEKEKKRVNEQNAGYLMLKWWKLKWGRQEERQRERSGKRDSGCM